MRIQAQALEKVVITAFHYVGNTVEKTVLLDSHRECEMGRGSGVAIRFIRQGIAHVGLIGPGGQQVQVANPGRRSRPAEFVARIEIEVVTPFGKSSGGLPVQINGNVIVEFAVEEYRAASVGVGIRGGRGGNVPV